MDFSKSPECNLHPGEVIRGKWHKHSYTLRRRLGYGATGAVYLADSPKGTVAVKIGHDSMAIASEVNVLKHFSKVQGKVLGPSLIDVDDWVGRFGSVPFYVMEYLKGQTVIDFMRDKKKDWAGILMVQLLTDLHALHLAGWAFGDLKPENIIVTGPPYRVRWIDVGGTTILGRSIKEYTEFYDRGYWGLGSRVAEPSYDLFSAAMVFIHMAYPSRFTKNGEPEKQLMAAIGQSAMLRPFSSILQKALSGRYSSAEIMRNALVAQLNHLPESKKPAASTAHTPSQTRRKRKKKKRGWVVETILVASFFFVLYFFYLMGQSM